MPCCNQCQRHFSDRSHFEQHLNAPCNADCHVAYYQRRIPGKYNLSRRRRGLLPGKRTHDDDFVSGAEGVSGSTLPYNNPDLSVFDFTDTEDNAEYAESEANGVDEGVNEGHEDAEVTDTTPNVPETPQWNKKMLQDFKKYTERAKKDY